MARDLPSLVSRPAPVDCIDRTRTSFGCAFALLAAAWIGPADAREDIRPFPAGRTATIESCVGGAPIQFRADDRRVVLEAVDAAAVGSALARRYPVLERDGLTPDGVVLWRKPHSGWLFVTLLADPAKPADRCFTATFVAERFEITAALLVKYFGAGVARE